MPNTQYDVAINGGGMVGLLLASLLVQAQFSVAVIEARKPRLTWPKEALEARVSAVSASSLALLQQLSVWQAVHRASYSPLERLLVTDTLGGGSLVFDCADIGKPQLGAIVENREIVRLLWEHLQQQPKAHCYCSAKLQTFAVEPNAVLMQLEPQQTITASVLIGADGAHSWVREHMQAEIVERPYRQSAIVAVVAVTKPHRLSATQYFLPTGPVALLPLADRYHCALVWSLDEAEAAKTMALSAGAFERALSNAFNGVVGQCRLLTARKAIPLIMRHARHYVQPRLALLGDAAHTLHPLAGQGVNLGFQDAAALAQCLQVAQQRGQDLGSMRVLRRYERARKKDNMMMLAAMRGFKECFAGDSWWLTELRSHGLQLTQRLQFVKDYLMHYAVDG